MTVRRFHFLFLEKLRSMCMNGRQRILQDRSLHKSLERKIPKLKFELEVVHSSHYLSFHLQLLKGWNQMTRVLLDISAQLGVAIPQLILQFSHNHHYRKEDKPHAEVGPPGEGAGE